MPEKNGRMSAWYQKCLEYYNFVPEYRDKIDLSYFSEKTACEAIKRAGMLYEEKQFPKDQDYAVRMDRLMDVMQEHEKDSYKDAWQVWLRYFVTMGNDEWKEFWRDVSATVR